MHDTKFDFLLFFQALHPYHYRRVQALEENDPPQRMLFARWFLQQYRADHSFVERILYTDEASFTREGIFNFHNNHFYAVENPHVFREIHFQRKIRVNVWGGVIGNNIIGPIFLPQKLTGQVYLRTIVNNVPNLLNQIGLDIGDIWFQQDGAPPHWSISVRRRLDVLFPNHWIGRNGPIGMPPRSPDLTVMDFFLWGWLKNHVYRVEINDENHLRDC